MIVRWAHACGIDVGNETWHRLGGEPSATSGHHIIRRNHVSDCGVCGIAAVGNNACSLVEDNLVERIGGIHVERIWENAGLKFHTCDTVLIRRNVLRHITDAPGLWLDYMNRNSRVTGNVIADIEGHQRGHLYRGQPRPQRRGPQRRLGHPRRGAAAHRAGHQRG